MSAGLGYKTFVTGDVLTAVDTNGYLMQGVLVFASAAARTSAIASPQEGQYSYLKDTNVTEYYNGSAWVGSGGGKVLQVVQGTTSTAASNSTTTFADTNLTATITPSATTSKVLVMVTQQNVSKDAGNASSQLQIRLMRDAVSLGTFVQGQLYTGTTVNNFQVASITYLDSPATTSATVYKTQFANAIAAASVKVQESSQGISTILLLEIGA